MGHLDFLLTKYSAITFLKVADQGTDRDGCNNVHRKLTPNKSNSKTCSTHEHCVLSQLLNHRHNCKKRLCMKYAWCFHRFVKRKHNVRGGKWEGCMHAW